MKKLELLRIAIANLKFYETPQQLVGFEWFGKLGLVRVWFVPTGGVYGLGIEGGQAVGRLTRVMFDNSPEYRRGISMQKLASLIANTIYNGFRDRLPSTVSEEDVARLSQRIHEQFVAESASQVHFVPCFVSPHLSNDFQIGPVEFKHLDSFLASINNRFIDHFGNSFDQTIAAMERYDAHWIAVATVERCESDRSSELAGMCVDVAIAGIQLVLPGDSARQMGRIAGRTYPTFLSQVSAVDNHLLLRASNQASGRFISAERFDAVIQKAARLLTSVGKRIHAFVGENTKLPMLNQAWTDAAY